LHNPEAKKETIAEKKRRQGDEGTAAEKRFTRQNAGQVEQAGKIRKKITNKNDTV